MHMEVFLWKELCIIWLHNSKPQLCIDDEGYSE